MRKVSFALAVLACVAAALVWSANRSSKREAGSPTEVGDAVPVRKMLVLDEPALADEAVASEETATVRTPVVEASHAPSTTPALLRLSGTIVVVDGLGNELLAENGRFQLLVRAGNRTKGLSVEVERGAWVADVPLRVGDTRADALGVDAFVMGAERVLAEHAPAERLPIPPDGRIELRVRRRGKLVLHVRERGSAGEVGAEYSPPETSWGNELEHPGLVPSILRGGSTSPIVIPAPWNGNELVYLRSDGHAWQKLEFGPRGCERVVELEPGGHLELTIEGARIDPGTQLRVFRLGSRSDAPLAEVPLHDQRSLRIESLPAGTLVLGAYLGDRWEPRTLGRIEVEIVPGETAAATLVLEEAEEASLVSLEGTLRMPEAWGLADFALHLALQGPPRAGFAGKVVLRRADLQSLGSAELFRWSAQVMPGTFGATLPDTGYFAMLEVGPGGRSDVHLEVPPPAVVQVRCVDESGAEAAVEIVDWGYMLERHMLPARDPVLRDPSTGRWTFRAPLGRLLIRAHTAESMQQTFADVVAGTNELELRVPRPTGIQPILMDGASEIPWQSERLARLASEGGGTPTSPYLRAGRLTLGVNEAGLYRLVVPEIAGYEPVPDEVVRVEAGVLTPHVVALRRKSAR